jgi:outer membrane PBP1 activator LpoA protein
MPWILTDDNQALHEAANEQWPDGHGRYERLFAMGIDTYRLQGRLYLLNALSSSELPGVTGRLHMKNQRIVRELNWAVFSSGKAKTLPQTTEAAQNIPRAITSQ